MLLDQIYRPAPGISCAEVEDHGVLLDCAGGDYYELDPTGLCAWKALDGQRPAHLAAVAISARFAVDDETARADVRPFLDALLAAGLIEEVPAPCP